MCPLGTAGRGGGRKTHGGRGVGAAASQLISPDFRGRWDADGSLHVSRPQDGVDVSTQKCAAVRACPQGWASLRPWVALPGRAHAIFSPLARTCPDFACHQSVQRSRLVFKVLAFQVIFRNINDWLLNQDALVALKKQAYSEGKGLNRRVTDKTTTQNQ